MISQFILIKYKKNKYKFNNPKPHNHLTSIENYNLQNKIIKNKGY